MQLLDVDAHILQEGLTYRKIEAKADKVSKSSHSYFVIDFKTKNTFFIFLIFL